MSDEKRKLSKHCPLYVSHNGKLLVLTDHHLVHIEDIYFGDDADGPLMKILGIKPKKKPVKPEEPKTPEPGA